MHIDLAAIVEERDGPTIHLLITKGPESLHKRKKRRPGGDRLQILKMIREAERQFAYREHGDEWRQHVGPWFSSTQTPEEQLLVQQAFGLIDERFRQHQRENS
jgi:hypothetical protein